MRKGGGEAVRSQLGVLSEVMLMGVVSWRWYCSGECGGERRPEALTIPWRDLLSRAGFESWRIDKLHMAESMR